MRTTPLKALSVFILLLALSLLYAAASYAFIVDWGKSWDYDNSYGNVFIGRWLVNNGYYADLGIASAFAKSGYIGFGPGEAPSYIFAPNKYTAQIVYENSAYSNKNTLGFYTAGVSTQLFSGTDGTGTGGSVFDMDENFGLYIKSNHNNGTYWYTDRFKNALSQSGANASNTGGDPQGLVYKLKDGQWLIAFEDLDTTGRSDNDYNDMYVLLTAVPEPVTTVLFGMGALGLGVISRRKKR